MGMLSDMKESWEKAFKKLHDGATGKTIAANQPKGPQSVLNIVS
jgi:hypothetical protein